MTTVLIADQDDDTRAILRSALRHERFNVIEAADADAAQLLALAQPVDLIVVNYPMRLRTGVSLTRSLREHGRAHLPILNFTSHVTAAALANAQVDGVTRTLHKPEHVTTVIKLIRALTDPDLVPSAVRSRQAAE